MIRRIEETFAWRDDDEVSALRIFVPFSSLILVPGDDYVRRALGRMELEIAMWGNEA